MHRGLRTITAILLIALIVPSAVHAESISELKSRLEDLKGESAAAGKAFDRAYWKLDETEVQLDRTEKRIAKTEKQLAAARSRLNRRANRIYRRDDLEVVDFMLGATSFQEFVTRLDYLERIGLADAAVVTEVESLRQRLLAEREELESERTKRAKDVKALRRERDKLQRRLKDRSAEYAKVKSQLDAARSGGSLPSGVVSAPGANGMVFPVVGSYYYSNTWGASRSGGRRSHQGTDIMAPRGTPCVAIMSGTVRSKSGGLGGKVIWLTADNGWQFYYAHLDDWAVRSGRVRAGQVIGTVGSTGNAAGGAPHLHFEIHPGGGAAVNPYPYLRAME